MKKKYRLSIEEIELLGLNTTKTNQYRLDEEQQQKLLEERNGFSDDTTGYKKKVDSSLIMSAINEDGSAMSIEEYCTKYGIDASTVKSCRLMNHLTPARYSIVFHTKPEEEEDFSEIDFEELFKGIKLKPSKNSNNQGDNTGVVQVGDLHLGAFIKGLRLTPEYSVKILVNRFRQIAEKVNACNFKKVHVHILGDLVESFSGLNHLDSFKGLSSNLHGAELIKFTTKVIHKHFLSLINNLKTVKIVGGNHDRFSNNKAIDNQGGVADVVAWGLHLIGYDVEFDSLVINHIVDGVSYILLHGDKGISKRKAEKIILDYGVQALYNVIAEAHLHSLIVKEDSHNFVRYHCRSLFTGNTFSEELGFTGSAGFTLFVKHKGCKVPDMHNLSLK